MDIVRALEVPSIPSDHSASGSSAEDLLIELFSDTFGAEKASQLYLLEAKSCILEVNGIGFLDAPSERDIKHL